MAQSARPDIVSQEDWLKQINLLREKEKSLTRVRDAVNALRRRLPMVKIHKHYVFAGEHGSRSLLDLFEGRKQLILYHFMFGPDWESGCPGCSWVTDGMSHPAHLNARDVSIALVSRAPLERLLSFRDRMGWSLPWYSSLNGEFNFDFGATIDGRENHVLSVFLREGDEIYRTYFTDRRGVEHLGSHWAYLDMVPYGRQEAWEDSPEGWPQGDKNWTRRHDEY